MIQSGNFIQSGSGQKLQKLSQVDGIDFSNMIREGSALYVQYSFGGICCRYRPPWIADYNVPIVSSWWFQPIRNHKSQIGSFPQTFVVNIKNRFETAS